MRSSDLLALRLSNQGLTGPGFERPEQVVAWLGAVQSQDFGAAKWAVGQRISDAEEAAVEQAFNEGRFLRTHVLRPTWHFVMPSDIRWMLKLTAPRVLAAMAYNNRRLGLDAAVLKRSRTVLSKALRGGKALQRAQLAAALEQSGIDTTGLRLSHFTMHAELEGVICSGPRQGRQFTYMLLDERVPGALTLDRDESLAELARRYFTSHGPASLHDFSWWSGLTLGDARRGVEVLGSELEQEKIEDRNYWFSHSGPLPGKTSIRAWLLPNFDEYVVAYTGRDAFFDPSHDEGRIPRNSMLSHHTILIDGRVAGTWKRTLKKHAVLVELSPFGLLTPVQVREVHAAADRYAAFLGLPLMLE
jgi:hypothetical protein